MFAKYFVTRWAFDTAIARADAACERERGALRRADDAERRLEEKDRAYQLLVLEVLALKKDGFGTSIPQDVPPSPLAALGAKARAALTEMGQGQSGAVKRAMTNRAITLALELRGNEKADDLVAAKIYRGEAFGS